MKITPTDLEQLTKLVNPLDTPEVREQYRKREFPRAELTKDLDKRYRWDLFHAVNRGPEWPLHHLYDYMNDTHIYTALKAVVPPL